MMFDCELTQCQQYIDRLREEYIANHIRKQERDELVAENNIEKRDIKGYHGREILELLQNADDAYQKSIDLGEKPECELEVTIEYKNNILAVTNTGTFFDKDGIKAIVQGNNSPKTGRYIGNKGTGFRSVLNWAEKVRIFSGNFNVEFSKEIADRNLDAIRNEPQIQKQLQKNPNLYMPMLAIPTNIDNHKRNDRTTIEVVINPEKLKDDFAVLKQIENIDLRILLFLPNISQIDIITENNHIVYKRFITSKFMKNISLQKIVDNNIEVEEGFFLFEKTIENAIKEDDTLKDIRLSIAVPKDFDAFSSRNIYSFFPLLDTESPFNCVLHASYALGDHRNTVNVSQANKEIIKEQIAFLIDVAIEFIKNDKHDVAHKILVPTNFSSKNWRFTSPFAKFELEDYYLKLLASQKIFLTVNAKNISVKDSPKMIRGKYPGLFVGETFNNLLMPLQDESVISLIEVLANLEKINIYFEERELLAAINRMTDSWSVSQQVDVFVWWNSCYSSLLPNLLKTQEGKWLEFHEDCYFLIGDFDAKGLPSWVKIPALHTDYQRDLFSKAEKSQEVIKAREKDKEPQICRIICQNNIYPNVGFKYRDRSNIISTINSSVDSYNKAIDFVKWLWGNYRQESEWNPPGRSDSAGFKYNFPCQKEKSIKDSEKLFLGSDYNNSLAEKLFDESYAALPSSATFNINENDIEQFIDFVRKFGVKKYPVVKTQEVYPIDSYAAEYEKEIKKHGDLGASTYATYKFQLPHIKNLEDILMKLSTLEILEWITKDSVLYTYLSNSYYLSDAKINYCGNFQRDYHRQYRGRIKNYILEVFNEVKWIELGKKCYSPRQILQNVNSRNNQKFVGLIPVISIEMLEIIAQKLSIEFDDVYEVFEKFSFADRITDLSSDDFYGLMLKLPNLDFLQSIELSKTIYRIIEQAAFTRIFEDSDNKEKFFQEGKVLVKHQGQLQYYPAKDAYLPSSKIISKKDVPIVEKGQRTNNVNFTRVLGCQEYSKEYSVISDSITISQTNDNFQKYYRDFQKYARAYAESNDNIERHGKNLTITLVNEISILENGKVIRIDDQYMCIRDTITNWYITMFNSEFDINIISELIENIYSNIANTPGFESGKLGELFRAREKSNREFLIKKEFGSLNVIEDTYYKNEIRNNFIKALKSIVPTYAVDEIDMDFDAFSNVKNTPCIIKLFSNIGIDVEQFKNAGFIYAIDLVPYFKTELSSFILKEKRRFKDVLYTRATLDESIQKDFINTVNRFINFNIQQYENSIAFNIEEKVINEFGEWRTYETVLSADEEYTKNYDAMNPCRRFEDEIANDSKAQLMIYFNKIEEFNKWLEHHEKQERENTDEISYPYSRYTDIVPKVNEISFHEDSNATTGFNNTGKINSHGGMFTHTAAEKRRRNQKVLGNKGEQLAYNLLCELVGKENVYPRSEAFVELGIIKPGQAISGEYDISYLDKDGTEYFVEVKTGDEKSFIISPGELQFAKENADKYKLFLVYNVDAEKPDCVELPRKFWENSKFRKNEIIERIEFEF